MTRTTTRHRTQADTLDIDQANERLLLGSIIGMADRHPGELLAIGAMVDAIDFVDPAHGQLYALLLDMHEAGEPVGDIGAVRQRIIDAGLYDDLGGAVGLAAIVQDVSATPRHYAGLVRRASHRRRIAAELQDAIGALSDPTTDHYAIGASVSATLDALASRQELRFESAGEIASTLIDALDRPARPMVYTGLEKFDARIGGFAAGELIVLAARTSIGKSAMAAQVAEYNAHRGRPVLFVTLEMEAADIVRRILSRESGASVKQIRAGGLTDSQRQGIIGAAGDLQGCQLYPHYMPTARVRDIRQTAKAFAAKHGIALLVVDYLQIIARPDARMTMRDTVADATRALKQLAGELACPVLALSQLNRESTRMESPGLAQLAECSSIEADADMVLAIHRRSPQDTEGELLVLKNRNGEAIDLTGLTWDGARMQFSFGGQYEELSS